jgi:hypothetical protein
MLATDNNEPTHKIESNTCERHETLTDPTTAVAQRCRTASHSPPLVNQIEHNVDGIPTVSSVDQAVMRPFSLHNGVPSSKILHSCVPMLAPNGRVEYRYERPYGQKKERKENRTAPATTA